jgi:hypothetical protein
LAIFLVNLKASVEGNPAPSAENEEAMASSKTPAYTKQ